MSLAAVLRGTLSSVSLRSLVSARLLQARGMTSSTSSQKGEGEKEDEQSLTTTGPGWADDWHDIPDIMPSMEDLLKGSGDVEDDAIRHANAEVSILPRKVNSRGHAYGLGKRKAAVARAWVRAGTGQVSVNGMPASEYFKNASNQALVTKPIGVGGVMVDVHCTVKGGGTTGQADAIKLAIARGIQAYDPPSRIALKFNNLLTRDNRVVERKKPGKAKARKSFQWVKR